MTWVAQAPGHCTPIQGLADLPARLAGVLARPDLRGFTGVVVISFAGDEFSLHLRCGKIVTGRRVHAVRDVLESCVTLQPGASL